MRGAAIAIGLLLLGGCGHGAGHGRGHHEHDGPLVRRFDNASEAVRMFERPGRDEYQKPDEVVAALELSPESRVADIGAGSGYFSRRIAAVATRGVVFAVDIEPVLVEHLRAAAARLGLPNLKPVLAAVDDPGLEAGSVDRVLIVNTWHHIPGRVEYMRRLAAALRPGARVVIIDYHKGELPVGPGDDHKLSAVEVQAEMGAASYRLQRSLDFLPYQYFLEFVR